MLKSTEYKKQIYTYQEKKTFLEILKNYSKIVENKNTNGSVLKAKNLAWQKIALEFNESPQTNLHRTPKQLRRLWLNMKQRQRDMLAKSRHKQPVRDEIISGSNMFHIAHALMTGINSSMESDTVLEIPNDPVQSETSLYLSEDSENVSNQETPEFNAVKIEPLSPINTSFTTPEAVQNPLLLPNNKAHVADPKRLEQEKNTKLLEIQELEIQLLKEKLRAQQYEHKSKEAHAADMHNLEYQIMKERLREAKAKADLAELCLRRQQ